MILPFLDRAEELSRLDDALASREMTLVVIYGRRRCGKSRLLLRTLQGKPAVYYIGDEREGELQRRSLAKAVAGQVRGFDRVEYPDWEGLLERWVREAPPGAILALDEFPFLARASPELPSLLQKLLDGNRALRRSLILCGSSQRMMQGYCLDATAPLYGRASQVLKIEPLDPGWIRKAIPYKGTMALLEAYSVWGGIPRYWEIVRESPSTIDAIRRHVLDPLGVLREEPARLLLDDLQEIAQASSLLSLIGEGCHKISEIAGRINKPATSLSRPLARLVDLELIRRDTPFGEPEKGSKRSLYKISDPYLRFWFRFASPRRSLAEARNWPVIERELAEVLPGIVGEAWEDLARWSVPRLEIAGGRWGTASRWWGPGLDRRPMEVDIAAVSEDGSKVLLGEAKLRIRTVGEWRKAAGELRSKLERFPLARGREVIPCIWYVEGSRPPAGLGIEAVSARRIFGG